MKNIILIIFLFISLLIPSNLVFADEEDSGSDQNFFIVLVKQNIKDLSQNMREKIKQEIQKSGEKAERKYIAPLKNKIQQGIDKTKEIVSSIKDFIVNLF